MTNEQLAILIRGYVLQLDKLIERLDGDIPESAERHLKWRRKDGKPGLPLWSDTDNPDFEQAPTGSCICLDGLRQFSMELWTQANELTAVVESKK